jgi:hypothetical protein
MLIKFREEKSTQILRKAIKRLIICDIMTGLSLPFSEIDLAIGSRLF